MTDRIGGPKGPTVPRLEPGKAESAKGAAETKAGVENAYKAATSGGLLESFEKVKLGRMQHLLGEAALQISGIDDGTAQDAALEGGAKGVDAKGAGAKAYEAWPCVEASKDQVATQHAEGFSKGAERAGKHAEGYAKGGEVSGKHAEASGKHAEAYAKHGEGYAKGGEVSGKHAEAAGKHAEGYAKHGEGYAKGGEVSGKHGEGYAKGAEGYAKDSAAKGFEAAAKQATGYGEASAKGAGYDAASAKGAGYDAASAKGVSDSPPGAAAAGRAGADPLSREASAAMKFDSDGVPRAAVGGEAYTAAELARDAENDVFGARSSKDETIPSEAASVTTSGPKKLGGYDSSANKKV